MKPALLNGLVLISLGLAQPLAAEEKPDLQGPRKEHEWLQQLVGRWDVKAEAVMMPGQPAIECTGEENVRAVGGLWTIAETQTDMGEVTVTGVMTLGYDPDKRKYIGTWVDSMQNYMWRYEGTLDESGKKLTLETEGPSSVEPGKTARYREAIEIKDKDRKVFTSSIEVKEGEWYTFLTANYTRKE